MFALFKKAVYTFIITAMLLIGAPAFSQIELAMTIAPLRALPYEPIHATVVIRNNTGGILTFELAPHSARFFFDVERNKYETARLSDRRPLLSGLKLVPAGSATNIFNLTSLYAMSSRGLYKVRACLEWNNILLVSPVVELEILKGFEIARVIAGVPGEEGALRVYILEYLTTESGEQIYLRIEDPDSTSIYGMRKLGHIVRVRKPEMKVDESGNVHVLFQSMSMIFIHTAFTPYGVQLFSREYADPSNRISLHNLPGGRVSVSPVSARERGGGNIPPASDSSATQGAPLKVRPGRGGLFSPK